MGKPILVVSACLCGIAVRYDGSCRTVEQLRTLWRRGEALAVCPECMGGLPVPRQPAERIGDGRVSSCTGADCTAAFENGARQVLALCRQYGIKAAVLKEGSPSCGTREIYDGSFSLRAFLCFLPSGSAPLSRGDTKAVRLLMVSPSYLGITAAAPTPSSFSRLFSISSSSIL